MIRQPRALPDVNAQWFDPATGRPSVAFYGYMQDMDATLRALVAMTNPVTVANLPAGTAGDIAFASNGRKSGQGAGSGTGVLVYHDGTAWRAVDTSSTVAA